MKTCLFMICLLLTVLLVSPAFCQQQNTTQQANSREPMVNLELRDVLVKDAFETLFKGTNIQYEFVAAQQNSANSNSNDWWTKNKISVKLTNVPFTEAVKALSRSACLMFRIDKTGKYFFAYDPLMGFTQNQTQNQSSNMIQKREFTGDAPGYGGNLAKSDSISRQDQAMPKAKSAEKIQTINPIRLGNSSTAIQNNRGTSQINPGIVKIEPTKGLKFDFTLDQANLFEVIRQVMDLSKKQYILDLGPASDINQLTVPRITAKIQNVTLDEFMVILKKSSGVQVINAGRTTIIKWRPTSRPANQINRHKTAP